MNSETIKIKCPCCGAILTVKKLKGIENKKIKCPACGESSQFKLYQQLFSHKEIKKPVRETFYASEETRISILSNEIIGKLRIMGAKIPPFDLVLGQNIIGRAASGSSASIQIPIRGNKNISREHIIIDVKKVPGQGICHYLSLFKDNVNETRVNNEVLEFGDCIVLKPGDIIQLPEVKLLFEVSEGQ